MTAAIMDCLFLAALEKAESKWFTAEKSLIQNSGGFPPNVFLRRLMSILERVREFLHHHPPPSPPPPPPVSASLVFPACSDLMNRTAAQ